MLIILCMTVNCKSQAYPLLLELKTARAFYFEGERIDFVISITNRDTIRTIPVLLPGRQSRGKKLLRLCWYAKLNKGYIQLQEEKPDVEMRALESGKQELVYLKPGQSVSTTLYLNDVLDTNAYLTKTESHHSFNHPFFEGEFLFKLHYLPKASSNSDTVFNYVDSFEFFSEDLGPVNYFKDGKLMMSSYGIFSNACLVNIKPNAGTSFKFEERLYNVISTAKYRHYYCQGKYFGFTTKVGNNKLQFYQVGGEKTYLLTFSNGLLKEYKRVKSRCNVLLEGYKYAPDGRLEYWCSTNTDNQVSHRVNYLRDGRMDYQYIYWNNGMATIIKNIYGQDKRLITEKRFDFDACR